MRLPQLTHPAELTTLSARELVARVRPILKKGGLTANPQRWKRIRDNVPSVIAELTFQWEQIGDRDPQPYGECIAARLCSALHDLDQQQNPHLYDNHRNYLPERETIELIEESEQPLPVLGARSDPAAVLIERETTPEERFQQTLTNGGVHTASQAGVWDARDAFNNGTITTPYLLRRVLDATRDQARTAPATVAFIQLEELRDSRQHGVRPLNPACVEGAELPPRSAPALADKSRQCLPKAPRVSAKGPQSTATVARPAALSTELRGPGPRVALPLTGEATPQVSRVGGDLTIDTPQSHAERIPVTKSSVRSFSSRTG